MDDTFNSFDKFIAFLAVMLVHWLLALWCKAELEKKNNDR